MMPDMSFWDRILREEDGTHSKDLQFFTVVRRRSEEECSHRKGFPTALGYLTDPSVI